MASIAERNIDKQAPPPVQSGVLDSEVLRIHMFLCVVLRGPVAAVH